MGFFDIVFVSGATLFLCVGLRLTPRNIGMLCVALLLMSGMAVKSWHTLSTRYKESSDRATYLEELKPIMRDHFFGVGLNNWSYYVTNQYGAEVGIAYAPYTGTEDPPDQTIPAGGLDVAQAPPAHNLVFITLGELGWPGLLLFAGIWLQWFRMGIPCLRRVRESLGARVAVGAFFAILAAFIQSATEWEFRLAPMFFLVYISVAILAVARYQRSRAASRSA
jgi:hypothetical protein